MLFSVCFLFQNSPWNVLRPSISCLKGSMLIAVQSPLVPWQSYLKDTQSNTKQHGRSFKLTTNRQKRNTNCKLFAWEKYNDHLNMICPVQVNMSRRISRALHPTWKKIINFNVFSVIGLFVCLKCLLTEHFNIISPIICSHRTEGLVWKKKSEEHAKITIFGS